MNPGSPSDTAVDYRPVTAVLFVFIAASVAGSLMGDMTGPGLFLGSAATVTPFVILAVLAYISLVRPSMKYLAYVLLVAMVAGLAFVSLLFGIVTVLSFDLTAIDGTVIPEIMMPGEDEAVQIAVLTASCIGAAFLSLIPFSRKFRILLSSRLDFSPDDRVHKIALVMVFALILIPLVPVAVTGVPPLLSQAFTDIMNSDPSFMGMTVSAEIYTLIWTIAASFVIAGLFTKRDLPRTLQRLGLNKPDLKQLVLAVGFGLALVFVLSAVGIIIDVVWETMGWAVTDSERFGDLIGAFLTPTGIIAVSVCAGFGEEIAVRGILQPRFGIILPAMLFASLHAFQYNWEGIITVFIAGLFFGVIRGRYSTTVSAITHTTYDLVIFIALMSGLASF